MFLLVLQPSAGLLPVPKHEFVDGRAVSGFWWALMANSKMPGCLQGSPPSHSLSLDN